MLFPAKYPDNNLIRQLLAAVCLLICFFPSALPGGDKIVLLDKYGHGSFKNGFTFADNGWTVVNGSETNRWELGPPSSETGIRRAIVSTDGGQTWGFDSTRASIVHFYRDITIPADAEEVYFTVFATGKVTPFFDEMRVYIVPTSTPVVAGDLIPFAPLDLKINERLQKLKAVISYNKAIEVTPGEDIRLVFTWTNSGNGGVQPGAATSLIGLSYTRNSPLKDDIGFQNPLPQGNDQNGALAIDANRAVITGNAGTLGKTSDGGASWSFVHVLNGLNGPLVSPILRGNDIFVVSQPNILLRSTDNGDSFETQSLINTDNTGINAIAASGQNFSAVGATGNVYHSSDGGSSWTPISSGVFDELYTVTYGLANSNEVIAAGGRGTVIKSTDGGASYSGSGAGIPAFNEVREVAEFDTGNYVAAAIGGLFRSSDSGDNWSLVGATNGFALYGLDIRNSNEGLAVGGQGFLLHTLNGWNTINIRSSGPDDFHQDAAFFPNSDNVYLAGLAGSLLHSTNNAGSFTRLSSGLTWDLNDLHFNRPDIFDPNGEISDGWAVGNNGTVLQTFNAGLTWTPRPTGTTGTLQAVTSNGSGLVMAVGSVGQNIRSTDGGSTWEMINIPVTLGLNDIAQIDSLSAIAVGNFGTVAITTDGGLNWSAPSTGISSSFRSIEVLTDSIGGAADPGSFTAITVGTFGGIYKTTDGGGTWDQKPSPVNMELRALHMIDSLYGHAVGNGGTVLRTTDGGESWLSSSLAAPQTLTALSFMGPDLGIVATREGMLLRTTDGTASWDTLASPITNSLNSVIFFDPYSAMAAGESGAIVYAGPDSVIITALPPGLEAAIPAGFALEQNYPNPFNPETVISYLLSVNRITTLNVYDILGRKVRTLAQGRQRSGVYTVRWDGRDDAGKAVASGVYFYRLKVDNQFSETRKMLLVR